MNSAKIFPAIVVVGYNRTDSLLRLLESLNCAYYPNNDITLIISLDKSNKEKDVLSVANSFSWNHGAKIIRTFDEKQGLRKHILACGDLSFDYGAVIILEDDLIVSPSFYIYTTEALNHYQDINSICGIALYSHSWNGYAELPFNPYRDENDVYFGQFSITWGQCWSNKQWSLFKEWYLENENRDFSDCKMLPSNVSNWGQQSWGKYFINYIVEKNLFYVIPYFSLTTNYSEEGEHNKVVDSSHQVSLLNGIKKDFVFVEFENGVKYDSFFERIFDSKTKINGIPGNEICVNLNGTKEYTNGLKYILSTDKKGGKIIESYGAMLRPIEANVLCNVKGSAIFLKKVDSDVIKKNFKIHNKYIRSYYLYHFLWRFLRKEGNKRLLNTIKNKITRG